MASLNDRKLIKLEILCNEIERLTGWRTMPLMAADGVTPCGVVLGDDECFDTYCEEAG